MDKENRIKVINKTNFDVGLELIANPAGVVVRAKSFTYMTEDDIGYNISRNTAFQKCYVGVEKEKEKEIMEDNGIYPEENPAFLTDDEIKKVFAGSAKKIEDWIKDIDDPLLLDRVFNLAKECNLPMNKLKVLQKYLPDKSFIDD